MARERTRLAWTRTAISFTAVGLAVLKTSVASGLTLLALVPVVWQAGRMPGRAVPGRARPGQLLLTALAVTAVAFVVLILVLVGHGTSPGFHPPSRVRAGPG